MSEPRALTAVQETLWLERLSGSLIGRLRQALGPDAVTSSRANHQRAGQHAMLAKL
jgi:hypothetical protein